jgi:hypothetical protein
MTPSLQRRVGRVLWSICDVERGGARVAKILQSSPLLTRAEAARLDQTLEEEALHMTLIREVAQALRPEPAPADAFQTLVWRDLAVLDHVDELTRFAWALAVTQWNERFSVRRLGDWQRVFAVLHHELGRRLFFIREQERGHVAWGEAVMARIGREVPALAARIDEATRWTRRIYPCVIHASHAAVYRAAAAEAGLGSV